jgi:hypothetical protein
MPGTQLVMPGLVPGIRVLARQLNRWRVRSSCIRDRRNAPRIQVQAPRWRKLRAPATPDQRHNRAAGGCAGWMLRQPISAV